MSRDATSTSPKDALQRDLALVLSALHWFDGADAAALVRGEACAVDRAAAVAAGMLTESKSALITGLGWLSIEAVREAVALAEAARATLLPDAPPDPALARMAVTQTATLGHLFACDLLVHVGATQGHPVADAVAERVGAGAAVEADLATVLTLRAALKQEAPDHAVARRLLQARRVGVLLAPHMVQRVASQWHKLATDVQRRVRLAVLALPDPAGPPNARGAHEVVCWQTGLSLGNSAISFANGVFRPVASPHYPRTAFAITMDGARIHIGAEHDADAAVSFTTPGLALGIAAQVMRCDGVLLWLCDPAERESAPPDPAVRILAAIRERVRA